MAQKRVHEIAKERGMSSKDVLLKLRAAGMDVTAAAAEVDENEALRALASNGGSAGGRAPAAGTRPGARPADGARQGAAPARPAARPAAPGARPADPRAAGTRGP